MQGSIESRHPQVHLGGAGARVLVSRSAAMRRVLEQAGNVAPTTASVLITGKTGAGKELVARLIHRRSPRAEREFIGIDCAALAPSVLESELFGHERGAFTGAERTRCGLFEVVNGGTLFLDEVGNLSLEAQAKLLRVLQEREFRRVGGSDLIKTDFRLIAASNVDLASCVQSGAFRADLYHRVAVFEVSVPALRERPEDIPLLVSHFVAEKRAPLHREHVVRVSREALDVLTSYEWPGNVRELENVVEAALVECRGDTIEVQHLNRRIGRGAAAPPAATRSAVYREARLAALERFEKTYVIEELRRFDGRVTAAAAGAGVTPKHFRTLMRRYGIRRCTFQRPPRGPGKQD